MTDKMLVPKGICIRISLIPSPSPNLFFGLCSVEQKKTKKKTINGGEAWVRGYVWVCTVNPFFHRSSSSLLHYANEKKKAINGGRPG